MDETILENGEACASCDKQKLAKHARELNLVNRISGQVTGVGNMITQNRYCPDILNQIRAARSALKTLESRVLETHLRTCVTDAFTNSDTKIQDKKMEEILDLFRRYEGE